jgi:hypothetical protein
MNHACIHDADVMRLKSAGCLTCESEKRRAGRKKTGVPTGNRTPVFTVKG